MTSCAASCAWRSMGSPRKVCVLHLGGGGGHWALVYHDGRSTDFLVYDSFKGNGWVASRAWGCDQIVKLFKRANPHSQDYAWKVVEDRNESPEQPENECGLWVIRNACRLLGVPDAMKYSRERAFAVASAFNGKEFEHQAELERRRCISRGIDPASIS